MKVKDLIKQLEQLDQEKDIHLIYDCCYVTEIEIERATEDTIEEIGDDRIVKLGDYIVSAG